jgi:oligogalacturonide lyase
MMCKPTVWFLALTWASLKAFAADASTSAPPATAASAGSPVEWIDPDTGHRVIRLSTEPDSRTLYFHDNSYTPQGDKLIFDTPSGVAMMDITKLGAQPPKLEIVGSGRGANMARRTREIYLQRGGGLGGGRRGSGRGGTNSAAFQPQGIQAQTSTNQSPDGRRGRGFGFGRGGFGGPVYAINVDTKQERLVTNAVSTVINCDETFGFIVLRGDAAIDPTGKTPHPAARPYVPQLQRMFPGKKLEDLTPDQQYSVQKEDNLARGTLNPPPAAYTFINLKTGERKTGGYQCGNLDHQQFNPTDPNLLLFAHEGTWHEVDRTWTIRTDGTGLKLMHQRTMDMEINGHEWWSWDGKMVWFDLQTPRSQDFWIAGVNINTGKETRYHITRDSWGVHFTSSRDNTLFASDGGDPSQVAYSTNGMWINLFRVQPNGTVAHERLVNMSKHNYVTGGGNGGVEPNCSITPDKKWVIFTGQFASDQRHVYAVEIARAMPSR